MIPVLMGHETALDTDSTYTGQMGLGLLADAVSCNVVEERNGEFYLEMVYPVGGANWEKILPACLIKAVPSDGADEQLFRIVSVRPDITGRVSVRAEHVSKAAKFLAVKPFSGSYQCSGFLSALSSNIANVGQGTGADFYKNRLTFEARGSTAYVNVNYTKPRTLMDALMGAQGAATDIWGVEYSYENLGYRIVAHTASSPRGKVLTEGITYGVNMTAFDLETAADSNYSSVFGFYYNEESATYVDTGWAVGSPYMGDYMGRAVIVDFSGDYTDTVPTAAQLRSKASSYVDANGSTGPEFSAKVNFAPTWQSLDYARVAAGARICLCDTVPITYERYGITLTAKVIKTDFDVLTERYRSIEVGTAKKNLGKLLAQTAKSAGVSVYR